MIRGMGYWKLGWESNGWGIYCASSRRFCIIKNGRLRSEKKWRFTGYCIADGQTDKRTVRTSGKTVYITTEVLTEKVGRELAGLLYDAHTLQYVAPTQVISLLRERY